VPNYGAHLAVTAVETRYDQGDATARRHGQPMVSTACGRQVTNTIATRRGDLVRCDDCLVAMASRPYVAPPDAPEATP